ncbi:MAG: DJ-1/PfpI family protein [Intestinimonas sp.]|jgi:4-methyl-5(b-hydroxyethyl)-thiazole monophosphate biosynthesis|nr:DJ-1/PfpI family protein [Intestinimonas sp.]
MVYLLLGNGFEEMEAIVTADLLRRAGAETALVGVDGLSVTGGHGIVVTADLALAQTDPDKMEMLVLPGGMGGVQSILENRTALLLIQRAWQQGCYLAALCAAPLILSHLGLLDRRRAVCYPGMEEQMGSAVMLKGKRVVVDGRIITGEGPGTSYDFGLKLVEVLKGAEIAARVRENVHYHG